GGRVDDPFALAFHDELARQVVAPARQAPLGAGGALGPPIWGDGRGLPAAPARALEPRRELERVEGRPGRQFAGELGQLVREALAQTRGGHLADAADRDI